MASSSQHRGEDDEEVESRFSHLLQPIRDLAKNWDIDIATALEDYLEELDHLQISLDGGRTNLNFAEAALLIQGTACIYSRKVEYLHSLVFQVLDRLTQQQQNSQAGNGKKQQQDGDGGKEGRADEDEEGGGAGDVFLLLDDVIEEGRDIDLRAARQQGGQEAGGGSGKRRRGQGGAEQQQQQQEVDEQQQEGGELAAGSAPPPHCRPELLSVEDHGNSFKLCTCTVHKSGALLLEEGLARELNPKQQQSSQAAQPAPAGLAGGRMDEDDGSVGGGGGGNDWGGGGNDDYDDYDDAAMMPMMDDDGPPAAAAMPASDEGDQATEQEAARQQVMTPPPGSSSSCPGRPSHLSTALQRRELRHHATATQQQPGQMDEDGDYDEEEEDPWRPLDPHDPGKQRAAARPFRKARPPRPPSSSSSSSATSAAAAVEVPVLRLTGLTLQQELAPLLRAAGKLRRQGNNSQAGGRAGKRAGAARGVSLYSVTTMGPAEAAAYQHQLLQRGAEAAGGEGEEEHRKMAQEEGLAAAADDEQQPLQDDDYDDDHDGGGAGGDWGGDYDDDYDDGDNEEGGQGGGGGGAHGGAGSWSSGVAPMSLEDAFTDAPTTYEDLCRKHIDSFMRGLEAFAHETQLTRRVADWQDKVEPLLQDQERRGAFDIHRYGDEIIEALATHQTHKQGNNTEAEGRGSSSGDTPAADEMEQDVSDSGGQQQQEKEVVSFEEMVSGKEPFEICRLFLASLQLVNNGNVKVLVEGTDPQQAGQGRGGGRRQKQQQAAEKGQQQQEEAGGGAVFGLELLSADRLHERFTGEDAEADLLASASS